MRHPRAAAAPETGGTFLQESAVSATTASPSSSTLHSSLHWRSLMARPGTRLLAFGALLLVLMIPLGMINEQVQERANRREAAAESVRASWGGAQMLAGPMLRLPWRETWMEDGTLRSRTGVLMLLPDVVSIEGRLDTEERRRGIFGVPVYRTDLKLSGRFQLAQDAVLPAQVQGLEWSRAQLVMPVSDPRTLGASTRLRVNGESRRLEPVADLWEGPGIAAALGAQVTPEALAAGLEFVLELPLNGSERLALAPTARDTRIDLSGDWPHPAFDGARLPQVRTVTDAGFTAQWSFSHLGRGYPDLWINHDVSLERIQASAIGVSLAVPVDPYRMAERMAKYALLLVLLCFAAIWVMELLGGRPFHPVQMLMLGGSLCLFGLLQLALAEHLGFGPAFVIAAAAVILQAGLYARSAAGSTRHAVILASLLAAWFAYLYVVLQAEDLALLLGSAALFLGLSAVMWATRHVQWSPRPDWEMASTTLDAPS